MPAGHEVEVKFRVEDVADLASRLEAAGFRTITPRTHEMNTLYDLPGYPLRRRGALLRIRQYGPDWTVTYKDKGSSPSSKHKSRREIETKVADGKTLAEILESCGFEPSFAYEKFRSEWSDSRGHVVVDETPIGNFAEIEGAPGWIDSVAAKLGVSSRDYITASYAELFELWKRKTGSDVSQMLFAM
jgi:adenylate cyclase, class 2